MNETPTIAEPLAADPGPEPGAGSTTWAPPPPPPNPPYPPQRPPLRRSRGDRVIAGVCGGIARQYAIDPVLLRILVVVLTIFSGGTFLIAYVLGWIFITDDPPYNAMPMPGTATAPGSGAYAGPSYAAGGTGTFVDPATGAVHGALVYTPAPRREPRSYLGLIALSVAVLVGGALGIAVAAGASIPIAAVTATMLLVLGIGLGVAAFRGRARWLIVPAVFLLLLTQAFSVLPRSLSVSFSGGTGTRAWAPTSLNPAPFELGAGDATLDLSQLPVGTSSMTAHVGLGTLVVLVPSDVQVTVHGRVGAGTIRIPGQPEQSGTSQRAESIVPIDSSGADPRTTVDLTAEVGLGELTVRRA